MAGSQIYTDLERARRVVPPDNTALVPMTIDEAKIRVEELTKKEVILWDAVQSATSQKNRTTELWIPVHRELQDLNTFVKIYEQNEKH